MARSEATGERRRAQLSRETILTAAQRITAGGGQVTFRALGTALDADPTAVYRHFRDKDELVRSVYDLMMTEAFGRIDQAATWREQIRQLAHEAWRTSQEHPHIGVSAPVLTTGGPGELATIDLMLRALRASGLESTDVLRFYGVIASYIVSVSANLSAQRLVALEQGTEANPPWLYDVRGIDAERYPDVAARRHELSELSTDEVYSTGIEVLLDAVEAIASQRTSEPPRPGAAQ